MKLEFVRLRTGLESSVLECLHNREFEVVLKDQELFFEIAIDPVKHPDLDSRFEVLLYSKTFMPDTGCAWVGLIEDFEYLTFTV